MFWVDIRTWAEAATLVSECLAAVLAADGPRGPV